MFLNKNGLRVGTTATALLCATCVGILGCSRHDDYPTTMSATTTENLAQEATSAPATDTSTIVKKTKTHKTSHHKKMKKNSARSGWKSTETVVKDMPPLIDQGSASSMTTANDTVVLQKPLSNSDDAFATEPHSRQTARIGSVDLAGLDKSVAVLGGPARLIDPQALSINQSSRPALQPLSDVAFDDYAYSQRMAFQRDMTARLANIDTRIDVLKAEALQNSHTSRAELDARISRVEIQQDNVAKQIDYADDLNQSKWVEYRGDFRSQLANLEQEINGLAVAVK